MEYRGYVHKERGVRASSWIAIFAQVDQGVRTVVEIVTRPTQQAAFGWAHEQVATAYESISVAPGRGSTFGVRLPRHCLWCGRLLRYERQAYCAGHRRVAKKNRARLPYRGPGCGKPDKAAYLHRGTAIMTARLLELDCYQCCGKRGSGCNAYHLTSQNGIIYSSNKARANNPPVATATVAA